MSKSALLAVLASLVASVSAQAQTASEQTQTATPVQASAENDVMLADLSGGQNTTVNASIALTEQDLTAVNSGNSIVADTVATGAITVRDSAFSDFNGVGNVIMNTGNNNNIQSTMSVTVVITP